MSAAALLDRLHQHGVALRADGDNLLYHPKAALTPPMLAQLRQHKWALLALLASGDEGDAPKTVSGTRANSSDQIINGEVAVAWRTAAMRVRHPRPWRAVPTLTARDVPRGAGGCLSCGEPVIDYPGGLAARCGPCVRAAHLVVTEGGER